MTPVAVIGLEIDAIEYSVVGVAAVRRSRSAKPKPSAQMIRPFFATATAMDGVLVESITRRMWARSESSLTGGMPASFWAVLARWAESAAVGASGAKAALAIARIRKRE